MTAESDRLEDAAEEYRTLGFEIHLEPFDPTVKSPGGCASCFESQGLYYVLYTRKLAT